MRCLALDAVMLMWVLNESDESNVTPRNFALLTICYIIVDIEEFVDEAIMPDFIKGFLHVKKYCRGGSSLFFCMADGLGELK